MAYKRPPWIVRKVLNPALMFAVGRFGKGPADTHVLSIRGRKTGVARTVPVNVLRLDDSRYLLSPRGETEWVKNLRQASSASLHRGGESETITVAECEEIDKPPVMRAYLRQYGNQVRGLMAVSEHDTDDAFLRAASDHPTFRIE